MFNQVPVDELLNSESECVLCDECQEAITGDAWVSEDFTLCESCGEVMNSVDAEAAEEVAEIYAKSSVKILCPVPEFDYLEPEHRCTPDEYQSGSRESHTENAHLCRCRHNCTNYDQLISGLNKNDQADHIRYLAIRNRVDELLCEALGFDEDEF